MWHINLLGMNCEIGERGQQARGEAKNLDCLILNLINQQIRSLSDHFDTC